MAADRSCGRPCFAIGGYSVVLAGRRAAELRKLRTAKPGDARMLPVPSDVSNPDSVRALFARAKKSSDAWTFFSIMRSKRARRTDGRLDLRAVGTVVRSILPVRSSAPGSHQLMKAQNPRGGASSAMARSPLTRPGPTRRPPQRQACHHRTHQKHRARCHKYDIACGQIDIGNGRRNDRADDGGRSTSERHYDGRAPDGRAACGGGRALHGETASEANVQFITLMAAVPFIGRG